MNNDLINLHQKYKEALVEAGNLYRSQITNAPSNSAAAPIDTTCKCFSFSSKKIDTRLGFSAFTYSFESQYSLIADLIVSALVDASSTAENKLKEILASAKNSRPTLYEKHETKVFHPEAIAAVVPVIQDAIQTISRMQNRR